MVRWAPIKNNDPTMPPSPQDYDASKEWAGKKVVLFSVPGAFTPACQARHLPPFIEQYDKLKAKDVDIIACIGYNDGWTMCAWGKVNGVSNDDIVQNTF